MMSSCDNRQLATYNDSLHRPLQTTVNVQFPTLINSKSIVNKKGSCRETMSPYRSYNNDPSSYGRHDDGDHTIVDTSECDQSDRDYNYQHKKDQSPSLEENYYHQQMDCSSPSSSSSYAEDDCTEEEGGGKTAAAPQGDQQQYKCEVCNKTFALPARLLRHQRIHTGEKPFRCEFCHKTFSVKENLNVHRRIHTKERPYTCSICGRAFEHSGKLHRHMRTHTGERPHKCEVCEKTFVQSGQLVIHMRAHTGEKPYSCSYCSKAFTCSKQLKVHIRTHTGEKPYVCDVCGKAFGYNHVLKMHKMSHLGEKLYKCTLCDKIVSSRKALDLHIKEHSDEKDVSLVNEETTGLDDVAKIEPKTRKKGRTRRSEKKNSSTTHDWSPNSYATNIDTQPTGLDYYSDDSGCGKSPKSNSPPVSPDSPQLYSSYSAYHRTLSPTSHPDNKPIASSLMPVSPTPPYASYSQENKFEDNRESKYSAMSPHIPFLPNQGLPSSSHYLSSYHHSSHPLQYTDSQSTSPVSLSSPSVLDDHHQLRPRGGYTSPSPDCSSVICSSTSPELSPNKLNERVSFAASNNSKCVEATASSYDHFDRNGEMHAEMHPTLKSKVPAMSSSDCLQDCDPSYSAPAATQSLHEESPLHPPKPRLPVESSQLEHQINLLSKEAVYSQIKKELSARLAREEAKREKEEKFFKSVIKVLESLIGKERMARLGHPQVHIDFIVRKTLELMRTQPCTEPSIASMDRVKVNLRLLLECCVPDQDMWVSFGWKGKPIEDIVAEFLQQCS